MSEVVVLYFNLLSVSLTSLCDMMTTATFDMKQVYVSN